MAFSLVPIVADRGTTIAVNTDADSNVETLKSGAGDLFKVEINNTANSSAVYLKMWKTTGAVGVGTDAPHYIFKCPASVTRSYACPEGAAFITGLKVAVVTTPGTAGSANPTNAVIYKISFT